MKHSVVSMFCGCGGLDLGVKGGFVFKNVKIPKTPFEILSAYDNDEKCIDTYHRNISNHAEVQDLAVYNPKLAPEAEVLIGGFPCQDFATCGPRHGLKSLRGRLYQALVRYMETHGPKVVIGENVPGLAYLKKGKILEIIKFDLERVGYRVLIWKMYAPEYGIPQRRTRLFLIAVRDDLRGLPTKAPTTF